MQDYFDFTPNEEDKRKIKSLKQSITNYHYSSCMDFMPQKYVFCHKRNLMEFAKHYGDFN